jgi:hypothetical protein
MVYSGGRWGTRGDHATAPPPATRRLERTPRAQQLGPRQVSTQPGPWLPRPMARPSSQHGLGVRSALGGGRQGLRRGGVLATRAVARLTAPRPRAGPPAGTRATPRLRTECAPVRKTGGLCGAGRPPHPGARRRDQRTVGRMKAPAGPPAPGGHRAEPSRQSVRGGPWASRRAPGGGEGACWAGPGRKPPTRSPGPASGGHPPTRRDRAVGARASTRKSTHLPPSRLGGSPPSREPTRRPRLSPGSSAARGKTGKCPRRRGPRAQPGAFVASRVSRSVMSRSRSRSRSARARPSARPAGTLPAGCTPAVQVRVCASACPYGIYAPAVGRASGHPPA